MNISDLSLKDFKELVNGMVDDRLCELLGDPDLGLPLDETVRARLKQSLASNAENLRHEPLDADLPGLAQYAVGDWRILYSIDREDHVVDIHRIGTRRALYRSRPAQHDS